MLESSGHQAFDARRFVGNKGRNNPHPPRRKKSSPGGGILKDSRRNRMAGFAGRRLSFQNERKGKEKAAPPKPERPKWKRRDGITSVWKAGRTFPQRPARPRSNRPASGNYPTPR